MKISLKTLEGYSILRTCVDSHHAGFRTLKFRLDLVVFGKECGLMHVPVLLSKKIRISLNTKNHSGEEMYTVEAKALNGLRTLLDRIADHQRTKNATETMFRTTSGRMFGAALFALVLRNTVGDFYLEISHGLHLTVNDGILTVFFLLVGKEIREEFLPGGMFHNPVSALLPIMCAAGGMVMPAVQYWVAAQIFEPEIARGLIVPTATDIAFGVAALSMALPRSRFSTMLRLFVLTMAIADDVGGLVAIQIFYTEEWDLASLQLGGLLVFASSILSLLMWKRWEIKDYRWYLVVPGIMFWAGFETAGLHAVLSGAFFVWLMPHEHSNKGIFSLAESRRRDALNRMETALKPHLEWILPLFAFVNAGVLIEVDNAAGIETTGITLAALVVGKVTGVVLVAAIGVFMLGLKLGFPFRFVVHGSFAMTIGFTVSIFAADLAFEPGPIQDGLKLGAFLSAITGVVLLKFSQKLLRLDEFEDPTYVEENSAEKGNSHSPQVLQPA